MSPRDPPISASPVLKLLSHIIIDSFSFPCLTWMGSRDETLVLVFARQMLYQLNPLSSSGFKNKDWVLGSGGACL